MSAVTTIVPAVCTPTYACAITSSHSTITAPDFVNFLGNCEFVGGHTTYDNTAGLFSI